MKITPIELNQINPEVSTVTVKSPLSPEEELSLYRYFKSVEQV